MTEVEYGVIYKAPDGRPCAVVFTPGIGPEVDNDGNVQIGYLVDGDFVDYEDTEMAYVDPDDLEVLERLVEAPVIDLTERRNKKDWN